MSNKEKHLFVEDDILAEKSLKGDFDNPKTLKDMESRTEDLDFKDDFVIRESDLKQNAINHIKHMRREGREMYYANIDEKSAIPKLMEIFNLNEEDLKNGKRES